MDSKELRGLVEAYQSIYFPNLENIEQLDELTNDQKRLKADTEAQVRLKDLESRGGQLGMLQRALRRTFSNTSKGKDKIARDTAADKSMEDRARQAGAAAVGQYYSNTTGQTYSSYSDALKDPRVAKAAKSQKTKSKLTTAEFDKKYGVNDPPGDEFAAARKNTRTFTSSTRNTKQPPTSTTTRNTKQPPTSTTTRNTKQPPTSTTTPASPAKPTKIQQDVNDLRRMQAASMMRQQNKNLPSGKIPTGDDLKPSTSSPTTKPTPTATSTPTSKSTPVNRATGSKKPGSVYSSFDMFDLVKGHLLDEGYADTEEAAIKIMANMSEEWRESILESGYFPTPESRRADELKYNLRGQTVKPRTVQTQAASKMKPTLTK